MITTVVSSSPRQKMFVRVTILLGCLALIDGLNNGLGRTPAMGSSQLLFASFINVVSLCVQVGIVGTTSDVITTNK